MALRDRIFIEGATTEVFDIYEELTTDSGREISKPFKYDREVFLAAAVIGCINNASEPLKKRKDKFPWQVLVNDPTALPTMQVLAVYKTNDPSVLLDDERVARIAEDYANAGIHILKAKLQDAGGVEVIEAATSILEMYDKEFAGESS